MKKKFINFRNKYGLIIIALVFASMGSYAYTMWLKCHDMEVCDKYMGRLNKNGLILIDRNRYYSLIEHK